MGIQEAPGAVTNVSSTRLGWMQSSTPPGQSYFLRHCSYTKTSSPIPPSKSFEGCGQRWM